MRFLTASIVCALSILSGCTRATNQDSKGEVEALKTEIARLQQAMTDLTPDLGDIMTVIHLHHSKLCLAGLNQNWDLAQYEVTEVKKEIDRATRLHEHVDGKAESLKELRHVLDPGITEIEDAIRARNENGFMRGMKNLTRSCNECHETAGFSSIVIRPPQAPMFTNEDFLPAKRK